MHAARRAGAVATMLLAAALGVAAVIVGRVLIFEYFHGSAEAIRELLHRLSP